MRRAIYKDGSEYNGTLSNDGLKHGAGSLKFSDGSQYTGQFENGFFHGLGIIVEADGSRYEGQFANGKFNGVGVFTRADGMKYEGEFRDGAIHGSGLVTFADGTHGLPRNEGYFESGEFKERQKCSRVVEKAVQVATQAKEINHQA